MFKQDKNPFKTPNTDNIQRWHWLETRSEDTGCTGLSWRKGDGNTNVYSLQPSKQKNAFLNTHTHAHNLEKGYNFSKTAQVPLSQEQELREWGMFM